ncbi:hypothetical protein H5410_002405, partial [Solanum commersonii]
MNYEWRPKFFSDCLKFGNTNEECWAKVSHDPSVDEFKEATRRKRRAQRKRRNIKTWQARPAIIDEAPDPAPEVNIHVHANKDNAGHGDVTGNIGNELSQREVLWQELRGLGANKQSPWIMSGDFNNVLAMEERIGLPVTQAEIASFNEMANSLQLTPLRTKGCYFTCCNKHQATSRVYCKSDWVFGNLQWLQIFSHVESEFLEAAVSDHFPDIIKCQQRITLHPKPFKLYTTMEHPQFKDILQQVWKMPSRGAEMTIIWSKMKRLK